jgi:hypothetical protein
MKPDSENQIKESVAVFKRSKWTPRHYACGGKANRVSGTGISDRDCSVGSNLSSQRSAKFREEMGNGMRLWGIQNEDYKPKQEKEITL